MNTKWFYVDDGYGIVGWGFVCNKCGKNNLFCSGYDSPIRCESCKHEHDFTDEEIENIEKSL